MKRKAELKNVNSKNGGKENAKGNEQVLVSKGDTMAAPKAAWTPRRHSLDHQEAHEESGILLFQAIPLPGISHILQREMWLLVLQFTALVTSDRIYNHNSGLKSK